VVIEAFSVSETVAYKSDFEKGNILMLTRLSPVAIWFVLGAGLAENLTQVLQAVCL